MFYVYSVYNNQIVVQLVSYKCFYLKPYKFMLDQLLGLRLNG